ncbi:MAG: NYN domain-containing protein [Pirellulaceae bacterium]|nr:NYN domain-containing protein [Pirellulaceae bacterium]
MNRSNPPAHNVPLFLIDGYNLWWNTGEFGPDNDDGTLQGARDSLTNWLVTTLPTNLREKTVLVFDAKNPPPNRGFLFDHSGLTVHFAVGYPDADTLMEEYILVHHAPRNLTVVTSDHRIQRAAKRKRATATDADHWARQIQHQFQDTDDEQANKAKPNPALSDHEVIGWMKGFGIDSQQEASQLEQEIEQQLKLEGQQRGQQKGKPRRPQ